MTLMTVRRAVPDDTEILNQLILRALEVSNLPDYGRENIDRVASHFTPEAIRGYMAEWTMFVAERDGRILGTGSHYQGTVRALFVDPEVQRSGAGRALMEAILTTSAEAGEPELTLRSSLFAEPFYAALGFRSEGDLWSDTERTIAMRRRAEV